jgi:hypothetical protein
MLFNFLFLLLILTNPFFSPSKPAAASEEEGIVWAHNRRLTWDDFKSPADDGEPLHAMTSTNIAIKAHCNGNVMRYDVKCVFVTKDSWTKNRDSKRLLEHEQMHFDLTEIHARLLRQKLNQTAGICGANRVKLDAVVEKYFNDWKQEQDLYDQETNHGLLEEKQNYWAQKISSRLNQSSAFSYQNFASK